MRISIRLASSLHDTTSLPPCLVKIGFEEAVLVDLQGALEVEGDKSDGLIGTLDLSAPVSLVPPKSRVDQIYQS